MGWGWMREAEREDKVGVLSPTCTAPRAVVEKDVASVAESPRGRGRLWVVRSDQVRGVVVRTDGSEAVQ
jgi:hypothetical protein